MKSSHPTTLLRRRIQARRVLWQKYGLSPQDIYALLTKQRGRCPICHKRFGMSTEKRLDFVVDHDHKTGEVRGLLHGECNAGLGMLRDNVLALSHAIDYLNRTPELVNPDPSIDALVVHSEALPATGPSDEKLISLWLHGKAAATRIAYRRDVAQFQAFAAKPIAQWALGNLQDWQDELGLDVTQSSVKRKLAAVKSLLKFAHQTGILAWDVGVALRLPQIEDTLAERILMADDVERMIRSERNRRNRLILQVLWMTGIRVSELTSLTWRDLKRTRDGGQLHIFGKGSKTREVPIPISLFDDLKRFRSDGRLPDPMFRSRLGRAISVAQAERIVRFAAQAVGIEGNVSPHWLRHTAGTEAAYNGCPMQVIQASLGHKSLAATQRYLHVRPGDSISRYLHKDE